MTRGPDPAIKPALLDRVVDYLLDKSLSTVTFRSLAAALGISTFTLVYHFGTRTELIRDIIESIAERQRGSLSLADDITSGSYFAELRHTFEASLEPRSIALQRLEFEAQLIEALETDHRTTRVAHEQRVTQNEKILIALGLRKRDAIVESNVLIDTFYGIHMSLIVNRDTVRARAAFDRAIAHLGERIDALQELPASK